MDTPSRTPEELIADIQQFLEREREMYGDFTIRREAAALSDETEERTTDTEQDPSGETAPEADSNTTEEPGLTEQLEACSSLDELRALCGRHEELLRTDLENTNLVFGVGRSDADLMVIGEAPGADEDRQGEPFVGRAGQLLNKILEAVDFQRDEVYIANILKHRPPNNRNPKPEERQRSLPFLMKQIELVAPKLILCLGKVAAQTLLDSDQTLGSMRGTFHSFLGRYELLVTYHPAALLRHEQWKRPTWEDVQKLRARYDELGGTP